MEDRRYIEDVHLSRVLWIKILPSLDGDAEKIREIVTECGFEFDDGGRHVVVLVRYDRGDEPWRYHCLQMELMAMWYTPRLCSTGMVEYVGSVAEIATDVDPKGSVSEFGFAKEEEVPTDEFRWKAGTAFNAEVSSEQGEAVEAAAEVEKFSEASPASVELGESSAVFPSPSPSRIASLWGQPARVEQNIQKCRITNGF